MEIKKGNIKLNQQIAKAAASTLVEGDIIVPDICPDVAEILCADAQVRITSTEYRNGRLNVQGKVCFSALYMPDDKCAELKCVNQDFDFSTAIDIKADETADFNVKAYTEHIGFTLINSRKIAVKVMVALKATAECERSYEPITQIDADDIECTEKKYSVYIPLSRTCTEIEVSDILTVPEDMPDIAEILKVDSWVTLDSSKTLSGKEMVHGLLHINTMYTAADEQGSAVCVRNTVPFTEIVEAPGADEQSVVNVSFEVVDIHTASKGDLNGDTKIISVEAVIDCCVKVSRSVSENVIDDCYFLSGKTECECDKMKICEYITSETARITEHQKAELPKNVKINEVINCCAKLKSTESTWEKGTAKVSGNLVTYLTYRDDSGAVRCAVTESELNWEKAIAESCDIEAQMWIEDISAQADDHSAQILANVGLYMKALKPRSVNILTDVCQKAEENAKKLPSMVVYFVREGDSLWSIAKKYRTKVEKIKNANNLDTDKIEVGRRLLIPKA